MSIEESSLGFLVLHALVHSVDAVEDDVVLGLLLVHLLQLVDIGNGVSLGLQALAHGVELEVNSVSLLLGVALGHLEVLVGTVHLTSLIGITASEEGHLSEVVLLGIVVASGKERILTSVGEGTPVLQHTSVVALLSLGLADVDEIGTNSPDAGSILLVELGLHPPFGIGLLVVFVTFDGVLNSIADAVSESQGVVSLHLVRTHLGSKLVLGDSTRLVGDLVHSQVNEVVVGLGLLGTACKLGQVLLQQL